MMASTRNTSSRAEIDHSNPDGHSSLNHLNSTASNHASSGMQNGDRLQINFSDFVEHCDFPQEMEDRRKTDLIHENKYRRTIDIEESESDSDSEFDSDAEPSPTPIISDLEEEDVMCDTPNIQRVMNANEGNDIKEAAFPLHGISIPYIFEEDSDTPEPLDTPLTPGFECNMNAIGLEELKLSSDENDSDLDYAFIVDEEGPPLFPALSPKSRSWQRITMTRMNYKRCKRIKSITPITTEMAEWKINNIYTRRRSVANITPTVHRLFKLDPDLLEIRQQYLEKSKAKDSLYSYEPMEMHHFTTIADEVEQEESEEEDGANAGAGHDRSNTEPFRVHVNRIQIPK